MVIKVVKKPVGRPKKIASKKVSSRADAAIIISTSDSKTKISSVTGKPVRKYTKKNTTNNVVKPRESKETSKTIFEKRLAAKQSLGKKVVVKAPAKERVFDKLTGFTIGSDQQAIAEALMVGGETRGDIIESLRKSLTLTTKNGTEKPIANLVSSVYNKLAMNGFRLESHFQLLPPTPASKRKATRLANQK